jgi:hypothetical protein
LIVVWRNANSIYFEKWNNFANNKYSDFYEDYEDDISDGDMLGEFQSAVYVPIEHVAPLGCRYYCQFTVSSYVSLHSNQEFTLSFQNGCQSAVNQTPSKYHFVALDSCLLINPKA